MITKYIQGNILDTELDYIAHGVNCQGAMGSGVAKAILDKYPLVREKYIEYCKDFDSEDLLGNIQVIRDYDKIILNCFTQFNYGYNNQKYVSYSALYDIFTILAEHYTKPIAIPKIGCGLAGGDWEDVEKIINEATKNKLDIWVYYLEEK